MLQKSQRILLRNLKYSFCKNDNKIGEENQTFDDYRKDQLEKNTKKHKYHQNQNLVYEKTAYGINWADVVYNEASPNLKNHLTYMKPQQFISLLNQNKLVQKLDSLMLEGDIQNSYMSFMEYIIHYIKVEPHDAYLYIENKVFSHSSKNVHFLAAKNKIFYGMINSLIQNGQMAKLAHFIKLIAHNYNKQGGSLDVGNQNDIVTTYQVICHLQFHPNTLHFKYQILSTYLQAIKIRPEHQNNHNKLIQASNVVFNQFISRPSKSTKQREEFEKLFLNCIEHNLFRKQIIQEPVFYSILLQCFMAQCKNNSQRYSSFFKIFNKISASVSPKDDYLESFFDRFSKTIQKSRLRFTDCQITAFPINSTFISYYKKSFEDQNKQIALVCVAIALDNMYLDIPQHFLEYNSQGFKHKFEKNIINSITEQTELKRSIKIQQMNNQVDQIEYKSKQTSVLSSLKKLIIFRNYQEAWQLFDKHFFNEACIQKEREKIKYVLNEYISTKKFDVNIGQGMKQKIIHQYVEAVLDKEYLKDSWKKSEDLGYLLQSYFEGQPDYEAQCQQQQAEGQQNQQNIQNNNKQTSSVDRFSFWDQYFSSKRSIEIHRLETLGLINDMADSQPDPVLQYHFNLNKYNTTQLRDQIWQKGCEQVQMLDQLELHLSRIQYFISDMNTVGIDKAVQKLKKYQSELHPENIKKLEEFGIFGYDIEIYDLDELSDRISTFRKYRGIRRSPEILASPYQSIEQMNKRQRAFFNSVRQLQQTQNQQYQQNAQQIQQGVQQGVQQQAESQNKQQLLAETNEQNAQSQEFVQQLPEDLVANQQQIDNEAVYEGEQMVNIAEQKVQVGHPSITKIKDIIYSSNGKYLISKQLIDLIRVKDRRVFEDAEYYTKVDRHEQIVDILITWGVMNKQPMGIYLGEKLACTLGQKIPHQLAIRVSDFFSHYRQVDEKRVNECKKCLQIIGPIRRQIIYDSNKKYQHIVEKKTFKNQQQKVSDELYERVHDLFVRSSHLYGKNQQNRQKQRKLFSSQSLLH